MQSYLYVAAAFGAILLALVGWLGWPQPWTSKYDKGIEWQPVIGLERVGWVTEWRGPRVTYLALWRPGDSTPAALIRDADGWRLQAPIRRKELGE